MRPEIERCRREIAEIETELRAGHRDIHGLLLALADWHAELRLLEREAPAAQGGGVNVELQAGNVFTANHLKAEL
jgi:hypothetical protein